MLTSKLVLYSNCFVPEPICSPRLHYRDLRDMERNLFCIFWLELFLELLHQDVCIEPMLSFVPKKDKIVL